MSKTDKYKISAPPLPIRRRKRLSFMLRLRRSGGGVLEFSWSEIIIAWKVFHPPENILISSLRWFAKFHSILIKIVP